MKTTVAILVLAGFFAFSAAGAFVEPTKVQIQAAVDNPAEIAQLLNGATAENAANVLWKVIAAITGQQLSDEQQKTRIALAVSVVFKAMPDQALELARLLAGLLPIDVLPTVVAAAAVVMGNQASTVTEAFISSVSRENTQIVRNAGSHPETILPSSVILALGVPVSHSGTILGRQPTAMPVAPPLIEHGTVSTPAAVTPSPKPSPAPAPRPPPPPVATNYTGL
jgi:hypothetical protein